MKNNKNEFKLAYLIELDFKYHLGVANKVLSQVEQLRGLGVTVEVFNISPNSKFSSPEINSFNAIAAEKEFGFIAQMKRYLNRILTVFEVRKAITSYDPNVIYLREGVYFPGLKHICKNIPVVLEVNSIIGGKEVSKNKVLGTIANILRFKSLQLSDHIVAISNEVKDSILNAYDKNVIVVSNGISSFKSILENKCQRNEIINILMVGSPGQAWQGYDLLIDFAKSIEEERKDIKFKIVGPESYEYKTLPSNIEILGFLEQREVEKLVKLADICVGTLAAFRKNIHEVSSLKHRMYASHLKPFFLTVRDTDFYLIKGVLTLPNSPNSLENKKEELLLFIDRYAGVQLEESDFSIYLESEKAKSRVAFIRDAAARLNK